MTIRERAAELREKASRLWRATKGDGCTSSPDLHYGGCCNNHDRDYTTGTDEQGRPITRAQADRRLRECMKRAGRTPIVGRWFLPWLYWAGVRVFGKRRWLST